MILNINDFYKNLIEDLKLRISKLDNIPKLSIVRVGNDIGAISFEKSLMKEAKQIGLDISLETYEKDTDKQIIFDDIDKLNKDYSINGIIILSPIMTDLDNVRIYDLIDPDKDVEGLNILSLTNLIFIHKKGFVPATADATYEYLKSITNLSGKDVLIINRSLIIGKPLAYLLDKENATVTMAHSKTNNIDQKIKSADIIVTAIGQADYFSNLEFKENAIVIDLGYSMKDGKCHGDIDFDSIKDSEVRYLPPLGGIGKINSNIILRNTIINGEENDR